MSRQHPFGKKFMIPGWPYSGPYMIPGRPYSGPYMIPGRSWQDHSKEICMISMVPYYGQIMIGLVGKPGYLIIVKFSNRIGPPAAAFILCVQTPMIISNASFLLFLKTVLLFFRRLFWLIPVEIPPLIYLRSDNPPRQLKLSFKRLIVITAKLLFVGGVIRLNFSLKKTVAIYGSEYS